MILPVLGRHSERSKITVAMVNDNNTHGSPESSDSGRRLWFSGDRLNDGARDACGFRAGCLRLPGHRDCGFDHPTSFPKPYKWPPPAADGGGSARGRPVGMLLPLQATRQPCPQRQRPAQVCYCCHDRLVNQTNTALLDSSPQHGAPDTVCYDNRYLRDPSKLYFLII